MEQSSSQLTSEATISKHELGTIICAVCGEVIGTLPSDGVKIFYSVCKKNEVGIGNCIPSESEYT